MFSNWLKRQKEQSESGDAKKSKQSDPAGHESKPRTESAATPTPTPKPKQTKSSESEDKVRKNRICVSCNKRFKAPSFHLCPDCKGYLPELQKVEDIDKEIWTQRVRWAGNFYCPSCGEFARGDSVEFCEYDDQELARYEVTDGPLIAERFQLLSYVSGNTDGRRAASRASRTNQDSQNRSIPLHTYLAKDLATQKEIAVKLIDLSDKPTVERVLEKAGKIVGLHNVNLIEVFAAGNDDLLGLYLITDHVHARSMKEELETKGRLSPKETVKVFAGIADALAYVHDRGIVHGAITLQNLLIEKEVDGKIGLVGNFGLAERMFQNMQWEGLSSGANTVNVFGSPDSMCPEFCKALRATALTDIYQLGSAMYEMLCGVPPFQRPTWPLVMMAHVNEPPDDVSKHRSDVNPELVQIIYKCLNKDPDERFPDAASLREALLSARS